MQVKSLSSQDKTIISTLIFLITFLVYISTLAPTVTFEDSGDFISAVTTLGIAHPPGYPLYILLGKLFTFLPIKNIAYRVNLMSAVFASFTCIFIYLFSLQIQKKLTRNCVKDHDYFLTQLTSVIISLSFAFGITFWSQALIAEVYTLNAFFTVLFLVFVFKFLEDPKINYKYLLTASFIFGLSLGAHLTPVLYLPLFALLFFLSKEKIESNQLISGLAFTLLGVSVYLLIPLRATHNPPINWDYPTNINNFIRLITRKDYSTFSFLARTPQVAIRQIKTAFYSLFVNQFTVYFWWLGIVGIWQLIKINWRIGVFFFLFLVTILGTFTILSNLPMKTHLEISIRDVLFIPAYLIYSIFIGLGLKWFISSGSTIITKYKYQVSFSKLWNFFILLICISIPAIILATHYEEVDKSRYYFAIDLGNALLDTAEKNAIIFLKDDLHIFPTCYLQIVERKREDVTVISVNKLLVKWFYQSIAASNYLHFLQLPTFESFKDIQATQKYLKLLEKKLNETIRLNIATRPIYFFFAQPLKIDDQFYIVTEGLLNRVLLAPNPEAINIGACFYLPPKVIYQYRGTSKDGLSTDPWITACALRFSNFHIYQGNYFAYKGEIQKAIKEFKEAIRIKPDNLNAYFNLATLYTTIGNLEGAKKVYQLILQIEPENEEAKSKLNQLISTQ